MGMTTQAFNVSLQLAVRQGAVAAPPQSRSVTPVQTPLEHWSLSVQNSPSSHGAPLVTLVFVQPVAGSQPSTVHGSLSSQASGVPGLHEPFWHVSEPLHSLPSSHSEFALQVQPAIGVPTHCPLLQRSGSLHTLPSLQVAPSSDGCVQLPLWHSSRVQTMPSSVQPVPSALPPFVGQLGDVPLHVSATSQSPVAGRHTVPLLPAG